MDQGIAIRFLIFVVVFVLANAVSLGFMFWDKGRAVSGEMRISEGSLFFASICFGALGVLIGMKLFRHKIRKWQFILGVPLALVQNILLLLFLTGLAKLDFDWQLLAELFGGV